MKNIISYIVGFIMVVLALIPPVDVKVVAPGQYWPYIVLIAGFLGFWLMFLKTNLWVKVVCLLSFLNCFFSNAPLISFNAYISVVACCYFYALCEKVRDYRPIFRMLQCLVIFEVFMVLFQIMGKDVLLNYHVSTYCFATVGQHMQTASFAVILASVLMVYNPTNILFPTILSFFCHSAGGFVSSLVGVVVTFWDKKDYRYVAIVGLILGFTIWMMFTGKFQQNVSFSNGSRVGIWWMSIKFTMVKWIFGYGIGTYQHIFPALAATAVKTTTIPWKTAHNCWVQIFFEGGIILLSFFMIYSLNLWRSLSKLTRRAIFAYQSRMCLVGLAMIGVNMCFHFPTRMIQTVPMIIFFLSYCEKVVQNGRN